MIGRVLASALVAILPASCSNTNEGRPYEAVIRQCDAMDFGDNDAAWNKCFDLGAAKSDAQTIPSIKQCVQNHQLNGDEGYLACDRDALNATSEKCALDAARTQTKVATSLDEQNAADNKCWRDAGFEGMRW